MLGSKHPHHGTTNIYLKKEMTGLCDFNQAQQGLLSCMFVVGICVGQSVKIFVTYKILIEISPYFLVLKEYS